MEASQIFSDSFVSLQPVLELIDSGPCITSHSVTSSQIQIESRELLTHGCHVAGQLLFEIGSFSENEIDLVFYARETCCNDMPGYLCT
jgi:hypothetical protein